MANSKLVSVLGGNGFLGRYLVHNLLQKGYYVKILSRSATLSKTKFISPKPGQLKLVNCDIKNINGLETELKGSHFVINLVGLLVDQKNNTFVDVHNLALKHLVKLCVNLKIRKLIHVSAIGAEKNSLSNYAKTKYYGEEEVKKFKNYCIVRPSIIFGDEDNFVNFFAKISKISPFLPLIGGGKNLFQPIWVQDVANIITSILDKDIRNKVLDVGGEETFSFKSILEMILDELELKRVFISMPFSISKKLAFVLEKLPGAVLTRDQVEMLKKDNIISSVKDYRKYFKYTPMPFKARLKKQLVFLKEKGGHFN